MDYIILLFLPTLGLVLNFTFKSKSKLEAIIRAVALVSFNIYIAIAGDWVNLFSVFFIHIPLIFFNGILIVQLLIRLFKIKLWWFFHWTILIPAFISILILPTLIKINNLEYPRALVLDYPLKNGTYFIIQGGQMDIINEHLKVGKKFNTNEIAYAVDIVKINKSGNNKNHSNKDLSQVEKHLIFNDTVYSPAYGIIKIAEDSEKDYITEHPNLDGVSKGNYLVIMYDDYNLVLAHLKMNSIVVSPGDTVYRGQPIAQVGHSGQSGLPHLHIHAYTVLQTKLEQGDSTEYVYPIPIRFPDGNFPMKNGYLIPR